jgi:hypothetical protein
MDIERDEDAKRLARIEGLLAEAKQRLAQADPTDRAAARQLSDQLDAMLKELRGPYNGRSRPA